MNAAEMHYDFKQKLNRIDSQRNRGLLVPEIDWKLNEAQEVFVKCIAQPRLALQLRALTGFEINQRTIDDIRTIVVDQKPTEAIIASVYDESSFTIGLPGDYWFLSKAVVYASKGSCTNTKLKTRLVQHDDESELSPFDRSSFLWRVSNIRFNKDGLRLFTDGTFTIDKVRLEYLKQPIKIHNAQDYQGATYTGLDGTVYTGRQSCELPIMTHKEIVDLAVLITAIDLTLPDTQFKKMKTQLTQLP